MGLAREEWRTGTKSLTEKSAGEMIDYSNSQISELIDDYIHNARNRAILKDRLIDGLTYEKIAEIYDMSYQQVRTIIYKEQEKIRSHSRYITDENTRNRYRFVIEQCKLRIKFKKEKETCCPVDDETKKEDSLWQ